METLKVEEAYEGSVLKIILNRPDRKNAISPAMMGELRDLFNSIERREDIRVVTITGAGSVFCSGADIAYMSKMKDAAREENIRDAQNLFDMFYSIYSLSKPVVSLLNGTVLGGGMGFLGVSDIVISSEGATLGFPEARLGIAPAVISPFLIKKYGEAVIRELFLSTEIIDSEKAFRLGLVNSVVAQERLEEELGLLVRRFLRSSPSALKACKTLIRRVSGLSIESARSFVCETLSELRVSLEGREGLQAFLEKRSPSWSKSMK